MRRQLLALALLAPSAAGCASLRGGPEMPGSFVAEGIAPADAPAIAAWADAHDIDLTVVGPESALDNGIADLFDDGGPA